MFVNRKVEDKIVAEKQSELNIKMANADVSAGTLSGGNQQKVVLAKWLVKYPKVLVRDEPTRGIDVGAKREIYNIICMLAKKGVAIVIISSELPELMGVCDRIVVMSNGYLTGEVKRDEYEQSKIMTLAMKGLSYEK